MPFPLGIWPTTVLKTRFSFSDSFPDDRHTVLTSGDSLESWGKGENQQVRTEGLKICKVFFLIFVFNQALSLMFLGTLGGRLIQSLVRVMPGIVYSSPRFLARFGSG